MKQAGMEPWRQALASAIAEWPDEQLAAALEVSPTTVWRWRNGERWPEPGMLLRICVEVGVTPDEVFGLRAATPKPPPVDARRLADALAKIDEARGLVADLGQPADAAKRLDAVAEAARKARTRQGGRSGGGAAG